MKKAFEFLFYCLYRMFALVKRVGEKDEILATSFYSLLLSTNTVMMFFSIRYIAPKGVLTPYRYLISAILGSFFFLWYFFCKNYFLKNGRYSLIIKYYEEKYKGKNGQMSLIGMGYALFTFLSFIGIASWLS